MRILITGSNGLLGQKLVALCQEKNIKYFATSKGENRNSTCPENHYYELDITNQDAVNNVFNRLQPTHVIHTAAITNVDFCELNPDDCELVNVKATEYLINASNSVNAHFQLLSTDFVFDGEKGDYNEEDEVNPLSIYAVSKVKGEVLTQRLANNWSVVRTIIVYGNGENLSRSNLIDWAKGALEKGDEINIIDDQFRAPTFSEDLAAGCMGIIENNEKGIFHISGPETMSIYKIVERIAAYFSFSMDKVNKISSSTLDQPAKRPPKTGFDLS
ncbi:MAG TPA: SDR family oxidoreductase, partial [Crocinitomicaceae bacterium]|nr:SDR family oxidoreductase [Crocinitomicaceae bacterium]